MTPHQTQNHLDGSVSIRIFAGGRWKVLRGAADGSATDYYECDACGFVADQNKYVRSFHLKSVREYYGNGEAA